MGLGGLQIIDPISQSITVTRGGGGDGWCPVMVARRAARKLGDAGRAAPSEALTK